MSNYSNLGSHHDTISTAKVIRIVMVLLTTTVFIFFLFFFLKHKRESRIEHNKLIAFAQYEEIGEFGDYGAAGIALVGMHQTINGKKQYLYGFINESYEECIPCIYQRIEPFEGERTIVELAGKYALINKKGEIDNLSEYVKIEEFCEYGFARALKKTGEYCLIGRNGKAKSNLYEHIDNPKSDWRCYNKYRLLQVSRDGKYGFLNPELSIIVPCEYESFPTYQDRYFNKYGLIKAEKNGRIGCLDYEGKIIIPFDYLRLWAAEYPMNSGLYVVSEGYREFGMINYKGDSIIECKYKTYDYERSRGIGIAFDTYDGYRDFYDKSGSYVKTEKIPAGEFKKISLW